MFTEYVAVGTYLGPIYLPVAATNSHNLPNHDNSVVIDRLLIAQPMSLLSEAKYSYLPYAEAETTGGRIASRMKAKSTSFCRRRMILMMACIATDRFLIHRTTQWKANAIFESPTLGSNWRATYSLVYQFKSSIKTL